MRLSTGLAPRRRETRELYQVERPWVLGAASVSTGTVLQPLPFLRNQQNKPSCVGQAIAECVDAAGPGEPWASAVDLWIDARRRQGRIENVLDGTRSEYAIESLIRRGWSSYTPGEDRQPTELDDELPDLKQELRATARRMLGMRHHCIFGDRVEETIAALRSGFGVVLSGGCRDAFFDPPENTVLGTNYRGGYSNGHCERVLGWDSERQCFVMQGSWGGFTYCIVNGRRLTGCYLADPSVIEAAWDVDVLEIHR